MYLEILESHPLWTKEAKEGGPRYTGVEMASAGGTGFGVGVGGGHLIAKGAIRRAEQATDRAKRSARRSERMAAFQKAMKLRAYDSTDQIAKRMIHLNTYRQIL